MKEETLAIRQLINDTDTKITIETAKREKEIYYIKKHTTRGILHQT